MCACCACSQPVHTVSLCAHSLTTHYFVSVMGTLIKVQSYSLLHILNLNTRSAGLWLS